MRVGVCCGKGNETGRTPAGRISPTKERAATHLPIGGAGRPGSEGGWPKPQHLTSTVLLAHVKERLPSDPVSGTGCCGNPLYPESNG